MTGARKDRMWIVGGIVAALLIAAASYLLVIGPKLSDADSVRDQTTAVEDQNLALQVKVNKLRADSAGISDLQGELADLHTQLPITSSLDAFTRQLTAQATAAGVTVSSIVIGVPAAVQPEAGGKTPPKPDQESGTAAEDSAKDAAATDTSTDGAANAPADSQGTRSAETLYSIPVTLVASGPLANQRKLLDAVQTKGPRRALVSSVQFAPDQDTAAPADEAAPADAKTAAGAHAKPADKAAAPPGGAAATEKAPVTMTVQLSLFVAPQTPDDEATLLKQLGG